MTLRLYYTDPYLTSTETRIKKRWMEKGRTFFVAESTIFYPGGGGQPPDEGWVNGLKLVEVREEGGEIVHGVEGQLEEDTVKLELNWPLRYRWMKLHTGQHLLSALLLESKGWKTLSFSITGDHASIEIDTPRVSWDVLEEVEERFLELCERGLPVEAYWVEEEEASRLEVRRKVELKGPVRVVEIKGVDRSFCGGLHVRSTCELGFLTIFDTDKVRGNARLYFRVSSSALSYLQGRRRESKELTASFSWEEGDFASRIRVIMEERKKAEKEKQQLEKKLSELLVKDFLERGTEIGVVELPLQDKAFRFMARTALERTKRFAVISSHLKKVFLALEGELPVETFREAGFKGGGSRGLYEFVFPEGWDAGRVKSFLENLPSFL